MAIFQQKSEAEHAAEQQAKAAQQQAAQAAPGTAERQAKEQEKARAGVCSSIRSARPRLPIRPGRCSSSSRATSPRFRASHPTSASPRLWQSTHVTQHHATDVLGQIEEAGWRLEHFQTEFIETGEVSRQKVMSSGTVPRTTGFVQGIYLFRRR